MWVENDPHARAYNVLFTPESKNMAAALNLGEPWKAQRCLSCHSAPVIGSLAINAKIDASTILADGVSCELCHGPAENYLAAHTIRAWLPKVMNDSHFGMNKTADIAVRGQICADCHVGQPGPDGKPWRDVNHDLIAGGHPRLSFELSAFMATMPPHWNPRRNPERFDELKSWLDGQFTSADAALRVLGARQVRRGRKAECPGGVARICGVRLLRLPSRAERTELAAIADGRFTTSRRSADLGQLVLRRTARTGRFDVVAGGEAGRFARSSECNRRSAPNIGRR